MHRFVKSDLNELAILGGPPAFHNALHIGRPNIGDVNAFLARAEDILKRRWLSNGGPYLLEFEKRIADYLGVEHCVAVCNATTGLQMAIRALGMKREVIVPSFTFIASVHALAWQGIDPVFCDVDPFNHTIDPLQVEMLIGPRTGGILGVHMWGKGCNITALQDIASRHSLPLLFDAAHAFGCSHSGRLIGGNGNAEVFSFHATKAINSFEGGAITTNDHALAEQLRLSRNFGFAGVDVVSALGLNGKMPEISAAMGLTSLEAMDNIFAKNQENYKLYRQYLEKVPGIQVAEYSPAERTNFHYIVVEVDPEQAGVDRDLLVLALEHEGVFARRYFNPGCHRMSPYDTLFPEVEVRLPHTARLVKRVLQLPTGTTINEDDVLAITSIIGLIVEQSGVLLQRIAERSRSQV